MKTSSTSFRAACLFALAGIALLGAALLTVPWPTLLAIALVYLGFLPFSMASYARVKRQRASAAERAAAAGPSAIDGLAPETGGPQRRRRSRP